MPDLASFLPTAISLGRVAIIAYAAIATILTTACLTLQALTAFDRRFTTRPPHQGQPGRAARRSLFVQLEPEAE